MKSKKDSFDDHQGWVSFWVRSLSKNGEERREGPPRQTLRIRVAAYFLSLSLFFTIASTDGRINGRTNGLTDERTDENNKRSDGRTDGRMNGCSQPLIENCAEPEVSADEEDTKWNKSKQVEKNLFSFFSFFFLFFFYIVFVVEEWSLRRGLTRGRIEEEEGEE